MALQAVSSLGEPWWLEQVPDPEPVGQGSVRTVGSHTVGHCGANEPRVKPESRALTQPGGMQTGVSILCKCPSRRLTDLAARLQGSSVH